MSYNLNKILEKVKAELKMNSLSIATGDIDPKDFISTGNLAVDLMLGKGIAFGYVVEWAGLSGSGKSLMLQMMLANAQKEYDAIGIWADRENAYTNKRATELGIKEENVIIAKPADIPTVAELQEFLFSTVKGIRSKYPESYIFIATDSISAFAQKQEGEDMGRKAKQIHTMFRKLLPIIDSKIAFHCTNQVTFNPGVMFGNPKTTTGGEATKYYSTYRLGLEDTKKIKDDNGVICGNWINFSVTKTRLGPSHREVDIPFFYKEGIPKLGGYVRMLVQQGYARPKNKTEFKAFKQHTVIIGDKTYNEDDAEKILIDHPELNFDKWPEAVTPPKDVEENEE